MDEMDKRLLTAIQADLPADERPFDALARRLNLTPEETLLRLRQLAATGVIRRVGPVFDSRRLGYASTLVTAHVPPERLAEVAGLVSRLPGVTHNYERRHALNLWFTLTEPSEEQIRATLDTLARETGVAEFHSLPASAVFKIRVQFDLSDEQPEPAAPAAGAAAAAPEELSDEQKALVRLLQQGLRLERDPLATAASQLGWTAGRIAEQIREWLASGVIRRFGAIVRHRELGYQANGMAVFQIPPGRVDGAGRLLAQRTEVSHCYRRPPLPDFPYCLYAMVHGQSEEEVRRIAAGMAPSIHATQWDVLFSVREFKKTSMQYFV